jgi:hypothetical protein
MKQGKYVVMEIAGVVKRPFIFPNELNHKDMADILTAAGHGTPVSAGNIKLIDSRTDGLLVDCYGFSTSLFMGPAEGDTVIIRQHFVELVH